MAPPCVSHRGVWRTRFCETEHFVQTENLVSGGAPSSRPRIFHLFRNAAKAPCKFANGTFRGTHTRLLSACGNMWLTALGTRALDVQSAQV